MSTPTIAMTHHHVRIGAFTPADPGPSRAELFDAQGRVIGAVHAGVRPDAHGATLPTYVCMLSSAIASHFVATINDSLDLAVAEAFASTRTDSPRSAAVMTLDAVTFPDGSCDTMLEVRPGCSPGEVRRRVEASGQEGTQVEEVRVLPSWPCDLRFSLSRHVDPARWTR